MSDGRDRNLNEVTSKLHYSKTKIHGHNMQTYDTIITQKDNINSVSDSVSTIRIELDNQREK